jgi:hypothetical protein
MDGVHSTSSRHGPIHQPVYQQHPAPSVSYAQGSATESAAAPSVSYAQGSATESAAAPSVSYAQGSATESAADAPCPGSYNTQHSTLFRFDLPLTSQQEQDMGCIEHQSVSSTYLD